MTLTTTAPTLLPRVTPTARLPRVTPTGILHSDGSPALGPDGAAEDGSWGKEKWLFNNGLRESAKNVHKEVLPRLKSMLAEEENKAGDSVGWHLMCTGHSLGAGTAAVLTMRFAEDQKDESTKIEGLDDVRGIVFAPPATVTENGAFAACDYLTSVIGGQVHKDSCR